MSNAKAIRDKTLGAKKGFKTKNVQLEDGTEVEIRQPSIKRRKEIMNAVTDEQGNVDGGDLVVWAAIYCSFVPGENETVFSEEDYEALLEEPTGSFVDDFGQAALELMNVSAEGKASENSEETSNSKTNSQ